MRHVVASLLLIGSFATQLTALQSGRTGAAGAARISACSLLTKELVTQVTPHDKQTLALVLLVPPMEDPVGQSGSGCSYGGITMNVDGIAPAAFEKQRAPDWVAVSGVGETAYFHDNKGRWAELYVREGSHVLTIQMDVPMGRTAASIQPNTISLAKAVMAKLK